MERGGAIGTAPKVMRPIRAGSGLGRCLGGVVFGALGDRIDALTGVLDSDVRVTGTGAATRLQVGLTVEEDAMIPWVVDTTRTLLTEDVTAALGAPPRQVDVLLRTRTAPARTREVATAAVSGR